MKSLTQLFLLCLASQILPAQTNPPPVAPPARVADRYLLVFDTSAPMKRRAKAVEQAARALIVSGMSGQLRRGDTIGLWTFNDQLYTGLFPLQVWRPEDKDKIAALVTNFLAGQKYEKNARFEAVMPSLGQVIEKSETITVLLFSDGATKMQGTPYDAEINAVYAEFRRTAQVFVTVLRAKRGRIVGASVNPAPWAVEFPRYPLDPQAANAPPPKLAENPPPAVAQPRPTAAPIILDMSKPKPPETNAVPPGSASPGPTPTNNSAVPAAEAKPVEPPTVAPAPAPASQAPETLPPTQRALPTTPKDESAAAAATQPEPATKQSPPAASVEPTAPSAAKPDVKLAPQSETRAPPPETSAPQPGAKSPASPAPGQTEATASHETVMAGRGALLMAFVLLTAAVVLVVFLLLRQRTHREASLITRSMERDKK